MKQFSYTIYHADDVDLCIERFRAVAPETCKGLLITLFTTMVDTKRIGTLTKRLGDAFPQAVLVGAITTDIIRHGAVNVNASVVSFSVFKTSTVRVQTFSNPDTLAEDGKKFCASAQRIKNLAAIGILGTLHAIDLQPFLDGPTWTKAS